MGRGDLVTATLDTDRHPLTDVAYQISCRERLDTDGALVLNGLVPASIIDEIVADAAPRIDEAFFADSTHNVYLTDPDPSLGPSPGEPGPVPARALKLPPNRQKAYTRAHGEH